MPFISPHTSQQKIPAALLNALQYYYSFMLIVSLSIFWKYIYLAAHISKHLFLHFSYIISYTLTTALHITHHNSSKLHSLTLKLCYFAVHKHISILFYTNLTAPISKYLNTSSYPSLTKYFFLESNLYNFSSGYNLILLLSLTSISLILSYIIHIMNITSHKTSISFTISMLLKRYQSLILKTLLIKGINF